VGSRLRVGLHQASTGKLTGEMASGGPGRGHEPDPGDLWYSGKLERRSGLRMTPRFYTWLILPRVRPLSPRFGDSLNPPELPRTRTRPIGPGNRTGKLRVAHRVVELRLTFPSMSTWPRLGYSASRHRSRTGLPRAAIGEPGRPGAGRNRLPGQLDSGRPRRVD
jgi:hypothetical protein